MAPTVGMKAPSHPFAQMPGVLEDGGQRFWGYVEQEVEGLLTSSVRIFHSPAPLERHQGAVGLDPRWTVGTLGCCFLQSPAVAQTLPEGVGLRQTLRMLFAYHVHY